MSEKQRIILDVLFVNHKQACLEIIKEKHIVILMQQAKMDFCLQNKEIN
jgi:hypothetical protein